MSADQITPYLGALLIVVGLGLAAFQMARQGPPPHTVRRGASVSQRGLKIEPTYPGLVLIGIGALLVLISAVAN
jgi:hypothetical protein